MWAPSELLVFVDPWFGGILALWSVFSVAVAAMFVTAVFLKWPIEATGKDGKQRLLAAISLLIGTVFAGPWVYGLIHLLVRRA